MAYLARRLGWKFLKICSGILLSAGLISPLAQTWRGLPCLRIFLSQTSQNDVCTTPAKWTNPEGVEQNRAAFAHLDYSAPSGPERHSRL